MELSKAEWEDHLARWRRSGQTATGYCERHGLKLGSLRYWSGRIRREVAESLHETVEAAAAKPARFARVRRRARVEAKVEARPAPLRLHVGDVQVEVPSEFDADLLGRVLEVLRQTGGAR